MQDYWLDTEELSSGQVARCEYLFNMSRTKIFREFARWVAMPKRDKIRNGGDFLWYLASKYTGRE